MTSCVKLYAHYVRRRENEIQPRRDVNTSFLFQTYCSLCFCQISVQQPGQKSNFSVAAHHCDPKATTAFLISESGEKDYPRRNVSVSHHIIHTQPSFLRITASTISCSWGSPGHVFSVTARSCYARREEETDQRLCPLSLLASPFHPGFPRFRTALISQVQYIRRAFVSIPTLPD